MSGRVAKQRPRQPRLTKHDQALVLDRIKADGRFRNLSSTDQHVLVVAVWTFMGGYGYWWPARETWAREANVCAKTITRATDNLVAVGLIAKQEYHRPPGATHRLNGSKIYRLDPTLIGQDLLRVPVESTTASTTRGDTESSRAEHSSTAPSTRRDRESLRRARGTQGQGVPAELDLSSEPRQPAAARERVRTRKAPPPPALVALLDGLDLDERGLAEMHCIWRKRPEAVEHAVQRAEEKAARGNLDSPGGFAISVARGGLGE
jgi:hypothetical protein